MACIGWVLGNSYIYARYKTLEDCKCRSEKWKSTVKFGYSLGYLIAKALLGVEFAVLFARKVCSNFSKRI